MAGFLDLANVSYDKDVKTENIVLKNVTSIKKYTIKILKSGIKLSLDCLGQKMDKTIVLAAVTSIDVKHIFNKEEREGMIITIYYRVSSPEIYYYSYYKGFKTFNSYKETFSGLFKTFKGFFNLRKSIKKYNIEVTVEDVKELIDTVVKKDILL